jgi:hypothetical protein
MELVCYVSLQTCEQFLVEVELNLGVEMGSAMYQMVLWLLPENGT